MKAIRAAISNGSSLGLGIDERGTWARRLRDLLRAHVSDLGGDDNLSEAERSLIRRASTLTMLCERLEQRFAAHGGEASSAELADYGRAANSLRRILETIGLERRAKPVLTPLEYARRFEAERAVP
jgi:hypothetical protein